ncbi:alpha/beta fold hydrolase [Actinomadura litoris]|uniref:Alpha/beta fold hydrolase n=1 Tax=Actinomadura litoris TaxID=2678616 RepID=A0A7K1KSS4_9ACTN|nr:alpha/beta fold hydrolase [Actinomadura litoris]MUN35240.1 alpha/beta fold hydrolase [Actinomadura litoris]
MTGNSSPVLLLHGFWFGSWCWSEVAGHVAGTGRAVLAVDMAGHGLRARWPACLSRRPFDPAALPVERSPVADVGVEQAGDLLVSQIRRLGGGRPVTVVAHSMGGPALTWAAQRAPELVAHAVYLAAFMPASGVPANDYSVLPENAETLVAPSLQGDPNVIGALRLDLASADPDYRRMLRRAFFDDIGEAEAEAAIGLMTPDSSTALGATGIELTRDAWGSVPRTYVTCARDRALCPPCQHRFIAEADAAYPENPTGVVALDSSHSPFLSMPSRVAEIIADLP